MQLKLKSYEMLEEENRELKTVMRKLCHEMGNALTLLGGSIFYLEHELKTLEEKNNLTNIKEDYGYICKLFGNLREYNHTEAIEKNNVMVTDVVDNIKDIFDKFNTDVSAQLMVEQTINTDEMTIYADMTKMRQVFINIIKNSIEAMDENTEDKGKKLTVRVSCEKVPQQEGIVYNMADKRYKRSDEKAGLLTGISRDRTGDMSEDISRDKMTDMVGDMSKDISRNKTGYTPGDMSEDMVKDIISDVVHIELRDNGKGIPQKNINDIFQPLYTFEKKNGSGLGLAVVKKIVEDHHGKIKAVSAIGTGTAMHIYFPVLKKVEAQENIFVYN